MYRMRHHLAALGALALLQASPAAQAASSLRVALQDLTITLEDLDPDDGVTPLNPTRPAYLYDGLGGDYCTNRSCDTFYPSYDSSDSPLFVAGLPPVDAYGKYFATSDSFGATAYIGDARAIYLDGSLSAGYFHLHNLAESFSIPGNTKLTIRGSFVAQTTDTARVDASVRMSWDVDRPINLAPISLHSAGNQRVSAPFEFIYTSPFSWGSGGELLFTIDVSGYVTNAPEPDTWALFGSGLLLLAGRRLIGRRA